MSTPYTVTAEGRAAVPDGLVATPRDTCGASPWTGEWMWWAGVNEEWFTVGPCATREQAIDEMVQDGAAEFLDETVDPPVWKNSFHVVQARQDPLRLSDWVYLDRILQQADESLADSDRVSCECDDGPWFDVTIEQDKDLRDRIRRACDEWQLEHSLRFHSPTFSHQRNCEHVVTNAMRPLPQAPNERVKGTTK